MNYLTFFDVDGQRSTDLKNSGFNIDAQHNRITFSEDSYLFEDAREYRFLTLLDSPGFFDFLHVLEEEISKMINNVSCHYFDSVILGVLLSIC